MGRLSLAGLIAMGCYDPSLVDRPAGSDAADAPLGCPAESAGCAAFTCPSQASCYQVCPPPSDFDAANLACERWGGLETASLVVIDSMVENACVFDQLRSSKTASWWYGHWIGFRQQPGNVDPAAGWDWVIPAAGSYLNWYVGDAGVHMSSDEPNDPDMSEDCAYMFQYDALGGGWADVGCAPNSGSATNGSVCEIHR